MERKSQLRSLDLNELYENTERIRKSVRGKQVLRRKVSVGIQGGLLFPL